MTAFRPTRQRVAVATMLQAEPEFRTAQELHGVLREAGERIGLTTVYRTLQALAESGEVDVLRTDDGEVRYRRCDTSVHHHHLVCRSCGTAVEVAAAEVETWAARLARRHGFTDVAHTVEVFGTCRSCAGR